MSGAKPSFIYKIIPASAAPPNPLPDVLPISDLDRSSGFIHLSTAIQVPKTLNLFFSTDDKVYILRLPYASVENQIKWEDTAGDQGQHGAEGFFPHLYNGFRMGNAEVDRVEILEKGDGWDEAAVKANNWLIY